MDSAIDPHSLTLKSKLPVKRKVPEIPATPAATAYGHDPRPPPFKFHRIWTEHDEIRFLQGLLNTDSGKLSFPRDLNIFYARFSDSMSQPYTKSQLSEKLRRLRKKFRVISTRLSKGLDPALLSPHDRELYNLSKQLWHPEFAGTSPFSASNCIGNVGGGAGNFNHFNNYGRSNNDDGDFENNGSVGNLVIGSVGNEGDLNVKKDGVDCGRVSGLIGVKVEFVPDLEMKCEDIGNEQEYDGVENSFLYEGTDIEDGVEGKLSEVDVKFEDCIDIGDNGIGNNQGIDNSVDFRDCNGDVDGNGFAEFCGGEIHGVAQNGGNAVGPGFKVEKETVGCDLSVNDVAGGAAKIVMNVFNEAVEEVRKGIVNGELEMDNEQRFEKRWQEQWGAELDVFAQRMRLILENSIPKRMGDICKQ